MTFIARDKCVNVIHLHGGDDVGVVQLLAHNSFPAHQAMEFPSNVSVFVSDGELDGKQIYYTHNPIVIWLRRTLFDKSIFTCCIYAEFTNHLMADPQFVICPQSTCPEVA